MRSRSLWIGLLSLLLCGLPAAAEERYFEFLRGLRERQYFDMALYYLDQMAARGQLPDEVRQVIPYERAITLLESSRASRSPEKQAEQLNQALAFLEQFVKDSPNHPKVAEANSERAEILIGKARVEILQSRSPANQGAKAEFQKRARDYVLKAREVYETASKQHEAVLKQLGTFIDRQQFPEKWAQREKAQFDMISAQINLAQCIYEEAQTHDEGSDDHKRLLNQAAAAFEELHQRHRSVVGGLYAQLYQGKCFEELGDLQKAMGIYNQLLSHPGDDPAMRRLQNLALHYKLICLNSKQRNDHQLVVDLGEEWLKTHKTEARTSVGLGIRWEVARAYEALGDRREASKEEAQRAWRAARGEAEQVNRFPSEFRELSLAMIQRLDTKLGGKERQPTTFDAAFGLGKQMISAIKEAKDALDAARQQRKPADEIRRLQQDLDAQLADAAKMFDLALRLANRADDAKSVNTARYMFAYVNFLQRKNYEAAILGEYVARTADKDDTTTGLDAAYLSMAAYVQAYNDAKGNTADKQADINYIVKACNLLTAKWPDSDKANDARMTLGRIYSQLKRPVDAAEWFGKVPDSDPRFAEAQLAAGQAYWTAYLSAARADQAERPTPDQLDEFRTRAAQLLRNGVQRMSGSVPKEGAIPAELIAGKMSLAQIAINQGQDAEAVKLLLDDPQSVVKAVTVANEAERPEKGIQSRQFATETYKLLLRAYIGSGKLNEARETMKTLEKVAGGDAGGDVTDLYVGLGKLLREELNRMRDAGDTDRFNRLMSSFETFLNDLAERKEGQSFGSLSWVGETYFALGEASENDPSRSRSYFDKAAAAFQEILALGETRPDFVQPEQVLAVKTRLARCLRFKHDFEAAERLLVEVLKQKPNDLRAQVEAASLYQAWGASGTTENAALLLKSIAGDASKNIWGWGQLGLRLQHAVEKGQSEHLPMFVEARLSGTEARRQYALAQTSTQKKLEELGKCEIELVVTVSVIKGLSDEHLAALNKLYHAVLSDAGKPIADLKPTQDVAPVAVASGKAKRAQEGKKKGAAPPPPPKTGNPLLTYSVLGAGLVLGLAGMAWYFYRTAHRKPVPALAAARAASVSFAGVSGVEALPATGPPGKAAAAPGTKPRPASAPKPAAASTAGSTAASSAGTKPPASAAAPGPPSAAPPKPKPKPNNPPTGK
jgi:hypothetical protein